MKSKINQLFMDQKRVHVLYSYNGWKNYIEQVVSFIKDGILMEEYVILIENERIYRMIQKELNAHLTSDQLKLVHHVNNFDFYYSSGSYHPPAIVDYFNKMVEPYVDNKLSFRSWAHVEWSSMEDPLHLIEDLEIAVDKAVSQLSFPLICAYDGNRMPEYLKTILMETHQYVLMEDDYVVSEQYHKQFD